MIVKKNKKVVYNGKRSKANFATDKNNNWNYSGSSKVFGDRYKSNNVYVTPTTYTTDKYYTTGLDLADV